MSQLDRFLDRLGSRSHSDVNLGFSRQANSSNHARTPINKRAVGSWYMSIWIEHGSPSHGANRFAQRIERHSTLKYLVGQVSTLLSASRACCNDPGRRECFDRRGNVMLTPFANDNDWVIRRIWALKHNSRSVGEDKTNVYSTKYHVKSREIPKFGGGSASSRTSVRCAVRCDSWPGAESPQK